MFAMICAKNDFHISVAVSLTSKLLCQLLLTWVIFHLRLNVLWFSVLEITVARDRRTDGTDGVQHVMWHRRGKLHNKRLYAYIGVHTGWRIKSGLFYFTALNVYTTYMYSI